MELSNFADYTHLSYQQNGFRQSPSVIEVCMRSILRANTFKAENQGYKKSYILELITDRTKATFYHEYFPF